MRIGGWAVEITEALVRQVAGLAQLEVAEAELDGLKAGMARILALADAMQPVDTAGVEPLANPLDQVQRLRPDEITEGDARAAYQALAPEARDGLYMVPRALE